MGAGEYGNYIMPDVELEQEPQLLFALAAALSASCASGTVSPALAAALNAVFSWSEHISVQLTPRPGYSVTVHPLDRQGSCKASMLNSVSSLAGYCYLAKAPASSSWMSVSLPDVEASGCSYCMCLPLLVDSRLSLLDDVLQDDAPSDGASPPAPAEFLGRYVANAASAACVGTLIVGAKSASSFTDRAIANMTLLASIAGVHLALDAQPVLEAAATDMAPCSVDEALADLNPVLDALVGRLPSSAEANDGTSTAASARPPSPTAALEQQQRPPSLQQATAVAPPPCREGAGSSGASTSASSSFSGRCDNNASNGGGVDDNDAGNVTADDCSASSSEGCKACLSEGQSTVGLPMRVELDLRQHPWLMNFMDMEAESTFLQWSSWQQLTGKRMINLLTGIPWVILAGLFTPWKLLTNAPFMWAVVCVYVLLQTFMLWRRPASFVRHYMAWSLTGWLVTGWVFPYGVGCVPLQYLTTAQMRSLWFAIHCGVLTSPMVSLYHLVPFRWYLVLQLMSSMANWPNVRGLCLAAFPSDVGTCHSRALAFHASIYLALGAIVYRSELHARHTFVRRQSEIDVAPAAAAACPGEGHQAAAVTQHDAAAHPPAMTRAMAPCS